MFTDDIQEDTPVESVEEETTPEVVEEVEVPELDEESTVDWEAEAKRLKAELGKAKRTVKKTVRQVAPDKLSVDEYIDISTSLDGLDQEEKAFLAEQHRLSGKPLSAIRESKDFQRWQRSYRAEQEAEVALKPNATQEEVEEVNRGSASWLKSASLEEKEAYLAEKGLWKSPRPRADRVKIGDISAR